MPLLRPATATLLGKVVPAVNENSDNEGPQGVSRRTVAKAMAWAVPVIAVSAAAPAYAASQGILQGTGKACKLPGNSQSLYKGYALGFSAVNPFTLPIIVTINSITLNGFSLGNLRIINLNGCETLGLNIFRVPGNTSYPNLVVLTEGSGNSQAGQLRATYTMSGAFGGEVTASASVDAVPPLQSGSCTDFTDAEKDCVQQQLLVE